MITSLSLHYHFIITSLSLHYHFITTVEAAYTKTSIARLNATRKLSRKEQRLMHVLTGYMNTHGRRRVAARCRVMPFCRREDFQTPRLADLQTCKLVGRLVNM